MTTVAEKPAVLCYQMTIGDLLVNPSVLPRDIDEINSQAKQIWRLIFRRWVQIQKANKRSRPMPCDITTVDLAAIALQYNARVGEIRDWLEPNGWYIAKLPPQKNSKRNYRYRLMKLTEAKQRNLYQRYGHRQTKLNLANTVCNGLKNGRILKNGNDDD